MFRRMETKRERETGRYLHTHTHSDGEQTREGGGGGGGTKRDIMAEQNRSSRGMYMCTDRHAGMFFFW